MNVRYSKLMQAGVVHAAVALETPPADSPAAITLLERQLLQLYGAMLVDTGTTLEPTQGADVVMPSKSVYLPDDFPLRASFSVADYPDTAVELADKWLLAMKQKVDDAVVALLAREASVASASVVTHPLPA